MLRLVTRLTRSTQRWLTGGRLYTLICALLMLVGLSITLDAQDTATIRFVHAVPNIGAIDVYIDGANTADNLVYGALSGYLQAPVGDHSLTATISGTASVLWQQTITVSSGSTSFIATSVATPTFDAFVDDRGVADFGSDRLLLVHGIEDGPAIDVILAEAVPLGGTLQPAGTSLANGMTYGAAFGPFDLPAQTYVVNILEANSNNILLQDVSLSINAGEFSIALIHGTASQPQVTLLTSSLDAAPDSGLNRFVHAAPGAPDVDIYVNDVLLVPSFAAGEATDHIALPAGDHTVLVRAAGTEDEVLTADLIVEADTAQTIVVQLDGDTPVVNVFSDAVDQVSETGAVVSFINTVPDSEATLSVGGAAVGEAVSYGEVSENNAVAPVVGQPLVSLTLGDSTGDITEDTLAINGGTLYTVLLLPGDAFTSPTLRAYPTSISRTIASAPDNGIVIAVAGTDVQQPAEPTVDTEVSDSTPETGTTDVVVITPLPAGTPASENITATVNLDLGANLQLRELPSDSARSLGLAPSGTVLTVVGREGAPVALVEGTEPPAEAADYIDPATLLASDDQDLDPEQTWLRVIYATPDGGQIEAWVNALYVTVRSPRNLLVRLAELPSTGSNVPGAVRDTDLAPPTARDITATARITNIDPGRNLNLRRTPTIQGEVLTVIPVDTIITLQGIGIDENEADTADIDATETPEPTATPEDFTATPVDPLSLAENWAFVTYNPTSGGEYSGWIAIRFAIFSYNGSPLSVEGARSRLPRIPASRIGEVRLNVAATPSTTSAAPVATSATGSTSTTAGTLSDTRNAYVGTVVGLDPGANLNLRRSPSRDAEILTTLALSDQILIDGRTEDGTWLRGTFGGQTGWVSAIYLYVSYNRVAADETEIPVIDVVSDPLVTPSPNGTPATEVTPEATVEPTPSS